MECHKYNVEDSNGKVLKVIKIGTTKDIKIAFAKMKAIYGDYTCFLGLRYSGTWTL